jgi:hypothetical protein
MAKTRGPGLSGIAIGMIGVGALAVYSAIKGTSPLEELRALITGKRPEPLSTQPRGEPIAGKMETATYQGPGGKGGRVVSKTGLKPHVAAEAEYIAATWKVEVQGFAVRNIAGTNTLSDHALGLAIDAMVPAGVQGQNIGTAIATHYRLNAAQKHVKYVIWYRQIWSPSKGSRPYTGVNPHTNHVHISFYNLGSRRAF